MTEPTPPRKRRPRPTTAAGIRYVQILLHGPYGTGKTTLANTMPGPRIVLDAEGGSWDLEKHLLHFEPRPKDSPWESWADNPELLTPDTTVVADVQTYAQYRKAMDVVLSGDHLFETAILDSITEIQARMKDSLTGVESGGNYRKATYDVWDQLQVYMNADVVMLGNMRRPNARKRMHSVLVGATNKDDEPPKRPILQGGLRRTLQGKPDLEGYLHRIRSVDEDGNPVRVRVLDIDGDDLSEGECKCRLTVVGKRFGDEIVAPDLTRDIVRVASRAAARTNTTKQED